MVFSRGVGYGLEAVTNGLEAVTNGLEAVTNGLEAVYGYKFLNLSPHYSTRVYKCVTIPAHEGD